MQFPARWKPLAFALAIGLTPLLGATHPARAEITGQVRVLEADRLEMLGQTIMLYGIDALQRDQLCKNSEERVWRCGDAAREALASAIGGAPVRCQPVSSARSRSGDIAAVCFVNNANINALMVEHGWALADQRESRDYLRYQEIAEGRQAGMWSGEFVKPDNFRQGERLINQKAKDETVDEGPNRYPRPLNMGP